MSYVRWSTGRGRDAIQPGVRWGLYLDFVVMLAVRVQPRQPRARPWRAVIIFHREDGTVGSLSASGGNTGYNRLQSGVRGLVRNAKVRMEEIQNGNQESDEKEGGEGGP